MERSECHYSKLTTCLYLSSYRFSEFKRFLVHLSHGRTLKRSFKLKEPQRRIKTVKDTDFARFFSSTENLQFKRILLLNRHAVKAMFRHYSRKNKQKTSSLVQ